MPRDDPGPHLIEGPGRAQGRDGGPADLFITHFFIDRTTGIRASIDTDSLPFAADEGWKLYGDCEGAPYASP